ncbi:MAG TPA: hypothetical protein VFK33_08070 [Bacillales bacterium]|nr:hypothetical protein [Bacillales bacterium]
MGKKSNKGYANTDFASSIITDGGIAAGTTVLSSIAGAAAAGAGFGSVVPGFGTIVGASVGLMVGIFMSTSLGKGFRNWVKADVKTALDTGVDLAKKGWKKAKDLEGKVGDAVGNAWNWATRLF